MYNKQENFHQALSKVLDGVDVKEYLEDVIEDYHLPYPEDGASEISSYHEDSDESDPEYELASGDQETSEESEDSDELNKTTELFLDVDSRFRRRGGY